jgi:hypothetical protein
VRERIDCLIKCTDPDSHAFWLAEMQKLLENTRPPDLSTLPPVQQSPAVGRFGSQALAVAASQVASDVMHARPPSVSGRSIEPRSHAGRGLACAWRIAPTARA